MANAFAVMEKGEKMLINREDAIEALGEEPEVWFDTRETLDEYAVGARNQWRMDVASIEALPSAERKGKWIKQEDEQCWWHECSECGDYPLKNSYGHDVLSDFCPNCGSFNGGDNNVNE